MQYKQVETNNSNNTTKLGNSNSIKTNPGVSSTIPVTKLPDNKTYSSDLNKSWPKIVSDLKQNGKIVLYTNLMNTKAEQINDTTIGIRFQKGITAFGKAVLDKKENIDEITSLVSKACGKNIQIKYISENQNQNVNHTPQEDIQKIASDSDIPFNIVD